MAGEVMGSLEVQIKSNAEKALNALDKLETKLISLGDTLDKVSGKITGLSNFSKSKIVVNIFQDAEKSAKSLGKAIDNVNKKNVDPKFNDIADSAKQAIHNIFAASQAQKTLQDQTRAAADEQKRQQAEIDAAATAMSRLKDGIMANLPSVGGNSAQSAAYDFDTLSATLDRIGLKFGEADNAADMWRKTMLWIGDAAHGAFGRARDAISENSITTEEWSNTLDLLGSTFNMVKYQAIDLWNAIKSGASTVVDSISSVATTFVSVLPDAISLVKSGFQLAHNAAQKFGSFLRTIGGYAKTAASGMKTFATALVHPIRSMKQLLGMDAEVKRRGGLLGNRSLGQFIGLIAFRRAITAVIRALVSGIKEGVQNLAQYSSDFNSSISSMHSGLMYLKNAWAAAFAPIVNAVAPYITAFINMLASALNAIGRFMAALTGKGFAAQAKPVFADYAAGLDKTGSSAGNAAKALEEYKKTIMSFDQLHVLNAPDNGGSGGGGGGGGGGAGGIDVSDMFTTVSVEKEMKGLAGKIAEAVKAGDWYKVGSVIADALNEQVDKLNGKWPEIQKSCKKIATNVGNTINGFVETFKWKNLGTTLAESINTVVITANTFLKTVHWSSIGAAIGDFISGAIEDIKWDELGTFAGNAFNALWRTLKNAVEHTNWGALGSGIGTSIHNFLVTADFRDAGLFVNKLFSGIANAIEMALRTSNNLDGLGDKIADFIMGVSGQEKEPTTLIGKWNKKIKDAMTWPDELAKKITGQDGSIISAVSQLVSALVEQLGKALNRPDVKLAIRGIGFKLGEALRKLPWKEILANAGAAIWAGLSSVLDGLLTDWQDKNLQKKGVSQETIDQYKEQGKSNELTAQYNLLVPELAQFWQSGGATNYLTAKDIIEASTNAEKEAFDGFTDSTKDLLGKLKQFIMPSGLSTGSITGTANVAGVGLGAGLTAGITLPVKAQLKTTPKELGNQTTKAWDKGVTQKGAQPIKAGVKDDSSTWWSNVTNWWSTYTSSRSVSRFNVPGANNGSSSWWTELTENWKKHISGRSASRFNVPGANNSSSNWWTELIGNWKKYINGRSAARFNVPGAINTSSNWWTELTGNWKNYISGRNAARFNVPGASQTAGTWWTDLTGTWKNYIAGRNASRFAVPGVLNQAGTWWSGLVGFWGNYSSGRTAGSFQTSVKNTASEWQEQIKTAWVAASIASKFLSGVTFQATSKVAVTVPNVRVSWDYHQAPDGSYSYTPDYWKSGSTTFYAAKGGILDKATLLGFINGQSLVAGEAGREAILPLDNNTAWMGKFASKVSENVTQTMSANIESAIERAVAAATMANGISDTVMIENHVTVKTQNDEVLARAVERGKARRMYRTNIAMA